MSVPSVGSPIISPWVTTDSLQAFIELVYIKTANDVMTSQMASLQESLATTKSAMDTLTQIQNLHNLIMVKKKFLPSDALFLGKGGYTSVASATFGQPIQVSFSFSGLSGGFNEFLTRKAEIISQLHSQISFLQSSTPTISGREDSNSLLAKLKLVLKDIDPSTVTISGVVYTQGSLSTFQAEIAKHWIIDNHNDATAASAGGIQQNITNAITAAQSLNTTQTESVRNFLYIFEEYYKSASAILQKIDQIINKMAGGIAR